MVGFVLEERYVVEGYRSLWLGTQLLGGRQPHIVLLTRFLEKFACEASKNEAMPKPSREKSEIDIIGCFLICYIH